MIIGAGLAGLRTAAELRAQNSSQEIILLGAESYPPYDRPPLSSELLSRTDPVWLAEDLSIDWPTVADSVHLGVRATGLTLGQTSTVHTDSAGDFDAANIVIATGSTPINPWPGTLTLTTIDDAARLRLALADTPKRVAIIGAGWIGVELAHVLSGAGHSVVLIEAGSHPLGERLGEAAPYVARWLDGVDLRVDTAVTGVEGTTVRTPSERITADLVITCVGVRPATDWLARSGISRDERGYLPVGPGGRVATAEGRVWAVGDVATRMHETFGRVDGGHWFSALRDPALVAADILGMPVPESSVPEVFSNQGAHHVETLGSLAGKETVLRGNIEDGSWVLFHLTDGSLVGAVVANAPRDTSSIRRALSRAELISITAAELADLSVPLRKLLRR